MSELIVINQLDLLAFGCPHCGCIKGGAFLSLGTCSLWSCETCAAECAVVEESICEMSEIKIRDTDICDLIGRHPYETKSKPNDQIIVIPGFQMELIWERLRN